MDTNLSCLFFAAGILEKQEGFYPPSKESIKYSFDRTVTPCFFFIG
jgi:hypothetical protein